MRNLNSISVPVLLCVVSLASSSFAQKKTPPHPTRKNAAPTRAKVATTAGRQKFALDVLHTAVSLPENDPQDRLRVLVSAARVASLVSPPLAKSLAREGMELESRMLGSGQQPPVSMVESGLVSCASVGDFLEAIRPEALKAADKTLSAALASCPKQALPGAQRKLQDALQHGGVPPRAMMAAMRAAGDKSASTLQEFDAVFSSLPDPKDSATDAPLFAALYEQFAPAVDSASARSSGVKLLEWIDKVDTSPDRVQAAATAVRAMRHALGAERFRELTESNPVVKQVADLSTQPTQMPTPDEEAPIHVGALDTKEDQTSELQDLPAPSRARKAAAYGFAAANAGNKQMASRYFDIAFGAINELWSNQLPGVNVPALIEEVSEAAATSDPVAALEQAQRLQDTSAQAISMVAVAQVVMTRQPNRRRRTSARAEQP